MPETVPASPEPKGSAPRPKRRRRWLRVLIYVLIGLPLLLGSVVLIVGQTSAMKAVVEPILRSQLGVDVQTGSIKLSANGTVVIRDALFTSPDIDGRAGDLIEIDEAVIHLNWGGLLRGSGQIRSIGIERPRVRVSQDTTSGRVNLAQLKFQQDGSGGATPGMEVRNGLLEIGEHENGDYRVLKTFSVQGLIERQDANGISKFALVALPTEPGMSDGSALNTQGLVNLTGEISPDGVNGKLDGLRLEDWPAAYVPTRSRAIYERLALAGELAPTRLTIDQNGQVEVILTLDGVSLNLPVDDTGSITGAGDLLRMRQTRGTITFGTRGLIADLNGFIDALEYDVALEYKGLDASSPFTAVLTTEFRLDDQFRPAKFLPENVISKLERFERPIADVDARVQIQRKAGEGIAVSGLATLSNGSAIYKKFRYPFEQLEGRISFDPDKLVIEGVTGVGPTGAKLFAEGLFSPLGEESVVRLNVDVDGVPVDQHLLAALDDDQRQLVDALFNEEDYQQMLDEGLLLLEEDRTDLGELRRQVWDRLDQWQDGVDGDQGARDAVASQLNAIDRRLAVPAFRFGGSADVEVVLRRHPERPKDDRWTTDVQVLLPDAGLVPGNFPLPIVANDVEITITDERVELTGGRYTGLGGGTASVSALVDLTKADAKPVVQISAREIPIDPRLVAAIPGYYAQQSEDPDDISLRRILDRLRLGGSMDCDATIGPRRDNRLGYDVEATISRGFARPIYQGLNAPSDDPLSVLPGQDPLALNDLYGTVYVTEELIIVDLSAMLSSPELPLAPTPISVLTQLTLPTKQRGMGGIKRENGLLPTDFGPPVPGPELYATARADGIDLAMPLHHAVAVVSPRIARDLLAYRDLYKPDGVLAIDAKLEGFVGGGVDSYFTLDRIESLAFDLNETRYELGASWGSATFALLNEPSISFDGFRVPIIADREEAGTLSLDGLLPLTRAGQLLEISEPSMLRLTYAQGHLDSSLAELVIDRFSSASTKAWLEQNTLRGRFDLDVTLSGEAGTYRGARDGRSLGTLPMSIHGSLLPRSLSLSMNDQTAAFDAVEGVVRFEGYSGRFENIRASDSDSSLALDGSWTLNPGEGLSMDLRVDARGDLLQGPVRAILPVPIGRVIDGLEINAMGGVIIEDMRVTTRALGSETGMYDIRGAAQIEQGSALIGLPITGLTGDLGFAVRGTADTLGYELNLDASRLRAGLMRVYDAQVQIIGDANNPGVILIPEIVAGMHGGRIAGSAQIQPGSDNTPHYWMEIHASGVRAAPVFDDLLLPPEGLEGPPRPGQVAVLSAWSKAEDLSRGALLGDLTMTGPIGDPARRAGRGTVQVKGGSVLALPGLINLIEASNLSLPTGATIDLAQADFYIDGPTLAFEQLSASSRKIEILGYGTLSWESRTVDMRFRSRAIKPIPVISQLFESLRDELITTRVTGTLGDLSYSVSQFSETRRVLNALLGNPPSEQESRLRQVEQQVNSSRDRIRRSTSDALQLPSDRVPGDWDWSKDEEQPRNESQTRPAADPQPDRSGR